MQEKRYIFPMKVGNPQFESQSNGHSRSQAIAVTASDDETARVPLEGAEMQRMQGFRWVYPSISGIDPKFTIIMAVFMGETRVSHGILVPRRMTHDVCCQRIKSSSAAVSFLLKYSADGCRFGTSKVSPLWVFWKVTHWQFATSLRTAETAHVLTGVRLLTIDFGR